MAAEKTKEFGSTDVAELVGIQPTLVNKFIEREQYGVAASVQSGRRSKGKRFFSEKDVYGIALVHWLFESGLRTDAIQFVLNQICDRRLDSSANDAASKVLHDASEMLVVTREPRTGYAKYPAQKTQLVETAEAARIVRENSTRSVLTIPVGSLFSSLREKMGAHRGNL